MSHSLSLYIAEHTRLVPETKASNQNRVLRHPSGQPREPFNFVSQSESSITSPESSANQNRALHHPRALGYGGRPFSALGSSRLAIAYLNT